MITGQVPTALIGSDAFQEADTIGITRHCTKHNYLVKDPETLAAVIDEATGGALHARYEARREAWRNRLARREESLLDVRRVEYEAWLVLQDEESTDE